jgi:hypothetical protein
MRTPQALRDEAEAGLARAVTQIAMTRKLSYAAWQGIAASRKLLPMRSHIAGASDDGDDGCRESVRARLASGGLPRLDGSAWASVAMGDHRCACCHAIIRAHEIEYEPRDQGTLYAHVRCFTVWLSESRLAAVP